MKYHNHNKCFKWLFFSGSTFYVLPFGNSDDSYCGWEFAENKVQFDSWIPLVYLERAKFCNLDSPKLQSNDKRIMISDIFSNIF